MNSQPGFYVLYTCILFIIILVIIIVMQYGESALEVTCFEALDDKRKSKMWT